MTHFELVEHEFLPDDQYTKEYAIIMIDGKYRVPYVRKETKDGRVFWGTAQICVTVSGMKKYLGFEFDSSFLKKDIEKYLDARPWECKAAVHSQKIAPPPPQNAVNTPYHPPQGQQMQQTSFLDDCPF